MRSLRFTALGMPRPQGSLRLMPGSSTTRPRLAQSPALVAWRHELVLCARAALPATWEPLRGPCEATARFYLLRPRSQPKRNPPVYVTAHGDLDKYVRAVGDALTDAGVVVDDRVIAAWFAVKLYVGALHDALDVPGVVVYVTPLDEPGAQQLALHGISHGIPYNQPHDERGSLPW